MTRRVLAGLALGAALATTAGAQTIGIWHPGIYGGILPHAQSLRFQVSHGAFQKPTGTVLIWCTNTDTHQDYNRYYLFRSAVSIPFHRGVAAGGFSFTDVNRRGDVTVHAYANRYAYVVRLRVVANGPIERCDSTHNFVIHKLRTR